MNALRIVIVDDEPLALDRMKTLLGEVDDVELVAASSTGSDALRSIRRLSPDLAILDVEMPKLDGFQIREAPLRPPPQTGPGAPLVRLLPAFPQFGGPGIGRGAVD